MVIIWQICHIIGLRKITVPKKASISFLKCTEDDLTSVLYNFFSATSLNLTVMIKSCTLNYFNVFFDIKYKTLKRHEIFKNNPKRKLMSMMCHSLFKQNIHWAWLIIFAQLNTGNFPPFRLFSNKSDQFFFL